MNKGESQEAIFLEKNGSRRPRLQYKEAKEATAANISFGHKKQRGRPGESTLAAAIQGGHEIFGSKNLP